MDLGSFGCGRWFTLGRVDSSVVAMAGLSGSPEGAGWMTLRIKVLG